MDGKWFVEERKLPKEEQAKEKKEIEKILRNSTIIRNRLLRMLQEDMDKTYEVEENFDDPAWERKTIAAAAERKTIRRYIKLLNWRHDHV